MSFPSELRRLAGRLARPFRPAQPPKPLPAGFDWRVYLERNPDLAAAGLADEAAAARHWREHGAAEGRDFREPEPPSGFDWRWYVESHLDLARLGIADARTALRHYDDFGRAEGRPVAPARRPGFDTLGIDRFGLPAAAPLGSGPEVPLACPSIDSLFLRAWGDLVCWDDAGAETILVPADRLGEAPREFLDGRYRQIRESLFAGRPPHPSECSRCVVSRLDPDGRGAAWDRRFVRMLRIEPSYHCPLDCPGCVPLAVRRLHDRAFQLDPERLDQLLAGLVGAGLAVDALDLQGHGEPLLNPRLPEMVRRSRARLPGAWISVTTSAQARFAPPLAEAGLDEIVASVDGAFPESYALYRRGGDLDLALRFLADAAAAARLAPRRFRVVWKYVLFEHNSSERELLAAQQAADALGVDEMVFVFTRNGPPSRTVTEPRDLPRPADGLPVSFRFHGPSNDDLAARLDAAKRLGEAGRSEEARELAASVANARARFFPGGRNAPARR